jgi:hypothetical protein
MLLSYDVDLERSMRENLPLGLENCVFSRADVPQDKEICPICRSSFLIDGGEGCASAPSRFYSACFVATSLEKIALVVWSRRYSLGRARTDSTLVSDPR